MVSAARFYGFGVVGTLMIGASIALVARSGHAFSLTGSCSSTGYSNGRSVPVCTNEQALDIILVFPSIFLGLLGLVVAGRRAPRDQRTSSLGIAAWSLGYLVVGGTLIASAWDPANDNTGGDRWGWAIPGFVFVPLGLAGTVFGLTRKRKASTIRRLITGGTNAPAVIMKVVDTGMTVNMNPRVRVDVEIRPPGGTPFPASKTMVVSRLSIPRVGDEVQVWYDANNPSTFALGLPDRPAQAAMAPTAPTAPGAPDTQVAQLERLAALKADGVLTAAEFESAKARLLGR